jgi:heme-degrading monooxygenase HmoA
LRLPIAFPFFKENQIRMWNIAQVNIARMQGISLEDPVMEEFVRNLDGINALAEQSPGFVWRLKEEEGNATSIKFNDDTRIIVNMSVWRSLDDLMAFVYKSNHREVMTKRKQWFEPMKFYMALWHVPKFSFPSVEDARFRLAYIEKNGITPLAFNFSKRFTPEEYVAFLMHQPS